VRKCSRPSGHWSEDDYDVLSEGEVVGRIMKVIAAPEDTPWMWTLAYGYHRHRSPTHGCEPTRELHRPPSLRAADGNRPVLPLARPQMSECSGTPKIGTYSQPDWPYFGRKSNNNASSPRDAGQA
jgi:hypothetical protein